jgi:hypothetical protein
VSGRQRLARVVILAFSLAFAIAVASPARAQATLPGRIEAGIGPVWLGGTTLGSSDATQTTATGSTARLFSTSSTLTSAAGLSGRVGVRIWRRLEAEVSATYAKPAIDTQISNDAEGAAALTASETVQQYTVGGGALWYLPSGHNATRWHPYVAGSVAYLRQLHQGKTLAVTGRMIDVGGGAKFVLLSRPRKGLKDVGVRGDLRLTAATSGVGFDDKTRYAPSLGASLFLRF